MGISADLYVLVSKDEAIKNGIEPYEIDDMYTKTKLHDLFPVSVHNFIYQEKCKIYDVEQIKEIFNDSSLEIHDIDTYDYGEFVTLSNGQTHNGDDLPSFEGNKNIIYVKCLHYLGSKHSFNSEAYSKYKEEHDFPYIRYIDCLDTIYDFENGILNKNELTKCTNECLEKYSKDRLFIDLNY